MDPAAVAAAWADLAARWGDEAAHRAFIDRFGDLEALAEVGRRYKEALDARPGDAMALRGRDEVVKRATVIAMAQLPRTKPPPPIVQHRLFKLLLAGGALAGAAGAGWALYRLALAFGMLAR